MRRTTGLLFLSLPAALLLGVIAVAAFNAQRALTHVAHPHTLAFSLRPLQPHTSLFEPVAAAPSWTTGATLEGTLYLGGPGGVGVFGPDGTMRQTLRPGIELPAAAITSISTGRLRGASEPQVLIATAGAGLLILTPGQPMLQQLLPAAAGAGDLTTVQPLTSGDLLLGTHRNGLFLYTGTALTPYSFTLPGTDPAHLEITALAAPDSTSVLIGTRNQGLFSGRAGTVSHVDTTNGLPDNQVEALAIAGTTAYAGTPLGTAQFDLAQTDLRPARTLAPGVFAHTLALGDGALTVGTLDQGVQQVSLERAAPRLRNASITMATAEPGSGRIDAFLNSTLALRDGTLVHRTSSGWTPALPHATAPQTLNDRNISALAFDPAGRLYIGFFDHGLDQLNPQTGQIAHLEDDALFCINRLALDPRRQTMAAATADGLVLFDAAGVPRQTLTRRDGLLSDHVTDIAFTRSGTVLATPAGLTFVTPAGTESLYAFQGLVNNHVYALAASPASDQVLAGTLGGLSVLEAEAVRRNLTVQNSGLKHNWITALAAIPGSPDTLIGTYGAGLERLSANGTITQIDLPAGAPHDLVINPNALLATTTHLYAGTLGHGLLVYTNATGRWTQITEGLPSLNVTAFATHAGELYIGTENGLIRTQEARLQ